MAHERIVVIGASAGGVRALQALASQFADDFPAAILVVQHIGSHPSTLPRLLAKRGKLPATHGMDGEAITAGRIIVAPPDRHMLVTDGVLRLSLAPRENHARPAIDPLFRSAAIARGPAVVGVVLTGHLDDGTAGLQAIKRCGGTTVVQDPSDAEVPSMPSSALRGADVDHVASLASMGEVLASIVRAPVGPAQPPPADIVRESQIMLGKGDFMRNIEAIAKPSTFVCPDCSGALWEISDSRPPRYRCHTGHAYSLLSLEKAQGDMTDSALWSALRALQEKKLLLDVRHREAADPSEASRLRDEAAAVARHAETLRALIERDPQERT